MHDEIQAVLRALEKGDISTQDALRLIEAIKYKDQYTSHNIDDNEWKIIKGAHPGNIYAIGENIYITPAPK